MLHRKFWLHYHSLRLALEVCLMLGAAVLCSYLIFRTQG
jgi:hypothetical protein